MMKNNTKPEGKHFSGGRPASRKSYGDKPAGHKPALGGELPYRELPREEFDDLASRILYEDNHLLILNKRPGEIVQGDKTGDEPLSDTLKAFIAQRDLKPGHVFMGVPHRLDRPVSGIAVFAKTSKALERLNEMFRGGDGYAADAAMKNAPADNEAPAAPQRDTQNDAPAADKRNAKDEAPAAAVKEPSRRIVKTYWALVEHCPEPAEGELHSYLLRNEKQNKSYSYAKPTEGAKEALLRYRLLKATTNYFLVEVELLTGRHHQIRCQLSSIGCPIKGDLKYGARRSNRDGGISLHARSISFIHPVSKQRIEVVAPTELEKY